MPPRSIPSSGAVISVSSSSTNELSSTLAEEDGRASDVAGRHERILYLDGWRGVAISMLLVGHFIAGFGEPPRLGIDFGRAGVEFFFVLSGLLMGNLLFVKRVSIRTFYK